MTKIRKPLIAGNWKMHLTQKEAKELALAIRKEITPDINRDIMLAPTFTNLNVVREAITGSGIFLCGQDVCWQDYGAFTGAVSALQLKDAGCSHVLIGHSERRKIFGETDEIINRKIKSALKNSLIPVLCIGETIEERENQKTYRVLQTQLQNAFAGIGLEEGSKIIIAYEPVWAIGTGKTATPQQAQDSHIFIRRELERLYNKDFALNKRIIYGGSVKAENIDFLMEQPDIDGVLVGGESLKSDKFLRIIKYQPVS